MKKALRPGFLAVCVYLSACTSSSNSTPGNTAGGAGGTSQVASTGGASSVGGVGGSGTGGNTGRGGNGTGGDTSLGGSGTGGNTGRGGSATGGNTGRGGSATGGNTSRGGSATGGSGAGGETSLGGTGAGGSTSRGGSGAGGETSLGGAGAGGGGASGMAGMGTGGNGGPIVVDVEIEGSIPNRYKQPHSDAGEVVRRSYACYYYTDDTAGLETDPSSLVLSRRDEPITKELNVYLPHGYGTEVDYPVIYVLHGLTDNEDTWFERGDPHPAVLLDNLIASGDIQPVVAVFPNGNSSSRFLERTFENQAGYYYFANELLNDIIPFVESEYSVKTDRNSRAIGGFSMGAMQTINVGLCQSLEYFSWFGAFAAAPTTYTADQIAQYLIDQDAQSHPINFFYNICGESDGTSESHEPALDGLTDLSAFVTEDNLAYHNVPGGHDYVVSSVGLYNLLRIAFSR
ncbi:MAG: hypothetical protein JW940_22060 [Polyangiaceae bacterium]|nr:hypothetical protein [Polyangiaceae bacterium]